MNAVVFVCAKTTTTFLSMRDDDAKTTQKKTFYKRTLLSNRRRLRRPFHHHRGAKSLTSMATMNTTTVAEVAESATLEDDTTVVDDATKTSSYSSKIADDGLAEAPALVGVSVADGDEDGIETVVLEENAATSAENADAKKGKMMMFTEEGQPFEGNNTNEFEDGVQAASLGSQLAFALAVVLLLVITGGTLYVSAREAMDRKEESDAREEMERQERIVEANKGRLNQDANKKRKPKVRNLDKLIAEGIVEPGSGKAKNKKLNRKERRAKRLASAREDDEDRDEEE